MMKFLNVNPKANKKTFKKVMANIKKKALNNRGEKVWAIVVEVLWEVKEYKHFNYEVDGVYYMILFLQRIVEKK